MEWEYTRAKREQAMQAGKPIGKRSQATQGSLVAWCGLAQGGKTRSPYAVGAPNLVGGWMILDFGMEKGAFVSPHYQRDCLKLEIPSFIISYFFSLR